MITASRISTAGHRAMVGSAVVRHLLNNGHPEEQVITRTHAEGILRIGWPCAIFLRQKS